MKMVKIHAKVGEQVSSSNPEDKLIALGLGSCVAVIIYDKISKIAVLSHIALPEKVNPPKQMDDISNYNMVGRYATTFLEASLKKIVSLGGKYQHVEAKIAGGGHMFSELKGNKNIINLGERNVKAVKTELEKHNIEITGEDVLGTSSRSISFNIATGLLTVRNTKSGKSKDF